MPEHYIYARKSSEDSKKQVESIPRQVDIDKELAARNGNVVVPNNCILPEEQTASKPGRPVFNQLMGIVESNDHTTIYCWHVNRLCRNPIDAGRIQWLLQNNKLTIITPQQVFDDTTNSIVSAVYTSEGTQFSRDLSNTIKGSNKRRRKLGIYPSSVSRPGYKLAGPRGQMKHVLDSKRFTQIQRAMKRVLCGIEPIASLRILNNEEGFLTRKRQKLGGGPLAESTWYEMLRDPFFCGKFICYKNTPNEQWYQGIHKQMITEEEYWSLQEILGDHGRPRPSTPADDSYLGLFKCAECGMAITRDDKIQVRCKCKSKYSAKHQDTCPRCGLHKSKVPAKRKHEHHYLVCAGKKKLRKGHPKCPQQASKRKDIEDQIVKKLRQITIPQQFLDWAFETLGDQSKESLKTENEIRESLQNSITLSQQRLDRLNELYKKGVYENEGGDRKFEEERQKELATLNSFKDKLTERQISDGKNNKEEEVYSFAKNVLEWFTDGGFRTRVQILNSLSAKGVIRNKTLELDIDAVFVDIQKTVDDVRAILPSFEPANFAEFSRVDGNQATVAAIKSTWLATWVSNQK